MKKNLSTRALITLPDSGIDLRGTFHLPYGYTTDSALVEGTKGRTAVVILNALAAPRSGYGDSAIYWADSFANAGMPCFRLDLPGLGDTAGDLPEELLTFITDGGYATLIEHKIEELVHRFLLDSVILMGHCAGAVTALYGASARTRCAGLILLDPYYNYARRITRMLPRLTELTRTSRAFGLLRNTYDLARELPRVASREQLPGNANLPLLAQWQRISSSGLPILVLGSPGSKPLPGQFDYWKYTRQLAGPSGCITAVHIESTDHSFSNRMGRNAVREHAERWLKNLTTGHLPPASRKADEQPASQPVTAKQVCTPSAQGLDLGARARPQVTCTSTS